MTKRIVVASSMLVLLLGWRLQADVPTGAKSSPEADRARAERLIGELGSESYLEREQAAKELATLGPLALDLLRAAANHPDVEISSRAGQLVARLEERAMLAPLLAPRKVRLAVKNMSVLDAVALLARLSDFPLEVVGDRVSLAERKITLDTGEVTFWEAFQQLSRHGGLTEHMNQQVRNNTTTYGQPVPRNPAVRTPILLSDGTSQHLPTSFHGSIRIMALPGDRAALPAGETQLLLDVAGEGRLQDFGAVGYAFVGKAIDEHGQSLTVLEPEAKTDPNAYNTVRFAGRGNFKGNAVVIVNGRVMPMGGNFAPTIPVQRTVAVRLKAGEKSSKMLKEVSGILSVQALGDTEALVKVPEILKAAGRTVNGKDGYSLQVRSVAKRDDGAYQLEITLENPAWQDPLAFRRFRGRVNGNFNNNGNLLDGFNPPGMPDLVAADGKACVAEVADLQTVSTNGQFSQQATLVYRPHGEPAQLVLSGRRLVYFNVPFALKDVPLP